MQDYLPYIVSVLSTAIAGFSSYCAVRRQTRNEISNIVKQHEVDLEALERKHQMEIEKINLEYSHQLELKEKKYEVQFSTSLLSEAMKLPEMLRQISQG